MRFAGKTESLSAMPKFRTVCLANAFPPDPRCGAFTAAVSSTLERLARSREWSLRRFCGRFEGSGEAEENFFPILSRMDGDSADARLWRGYRMLASSSIQNAERVATAARRGNAFLILDPCGLSAQEWALASAQAREPVPWADSDWPRGFPACDPFWTLALRHRHSLSPATLIASALTRSLYGEPPSPTKNFCRVRSAIFASETLRERNAGAFPNLERSVVIPPAVDEIFTFEATSPERSRVWGWNGGFSEKSGVLVALDAFARQAFAEPRMRMLLAGDAETEAAELLRRKISGVPVLAERVEFVGEIPRKRLAADFFRRVGLFVHVPADESAFPLEAAEAMACGCLVFASMTEEMKNLVPADAPLLFNVRAPETARLMGDSLMRMSPEEWALIAADAAARVQESFSPARVEAALAEFLESVGRTDSGE